MERRLESTYDENGLLKSASTSRSKEKRLNDLLVHGGSKLVRSAPRKRVSSKENERPHRRTRLVFVSSPLIST